LSDIVEAHVQCDDCGSSDAKTVYVDHTYCFSCKTRHSTGESDDTPKLKKSKSERPLIPFGKFSALLARDISEETCKRYGYFLGKDADGKNVQVAPYRDRKGNVVAQKVRGANKRFFTTGSFKDLALFGQHLYRNGGKRLMVVEGEVDALAASQMLGTWPVVSIPNGAQGAAKSIRDNIDFLESYETVVFCFDMDDPGRAAAQECAELLTPGRAAIMEMSEKDAGDMLTEGKVKEFVSSFWEAREVRPDGIINGVDLWDALDLEVEMGISYPWSELDGPTYGQRKGELVTWTSGTGMGKSTAVAEIAYDLLMKGYKVGYVALEENVGRTAKRMLGIHLSKPVHLPGHTVSADEKKEAFDATLGTGRFYTFDHFGSIGSDTILNKVRYLAKGCGCDFIILDHLSIIVSGMDVSEDERRTIDMLMTQLRSIVEETGVGMHLVSHLKRPSGDKGHENGAEVSLSQLRGSHSIVQLSDIVIAIERDQQAEDKDERDTNRMRILKNRYAGITGLAAQVRYVRETGRLVPEEQAVLEEAEDSPF
jgi:twinkle protein